MFGCTYGVAYDVGSYGFGQGPWPGLDSVYTCFRCHTHGVAQDVMSYGFGQGFRPRTTVWFRLSIYVGKCFPCHTYGVAHDVGSYRFGQVPKPGFGSVYTPLGVPRQAFSMVCPSLVVPAPFCQSYAYLDCRPVRPLVDEPSIRWFSYTL